jgi:hypothetical protein
VRGRLSRVAPIVAGQAPAAGAPIAVTVNWVAPVLVPGVTDALPMVAYVLKGPPIEQVPAVAMSA